MTRFRKFLLAAPLLPLLAACERRTTVITDNGYPTRRTAAVEEPMSSTDVSGPVEFPVDDEQDDVSYVVYREYYDASDEEISYIPYYRRYYSLDESDLFLLFFVARHTNQPIDAVIRHYHYDSGRDYDRLVVSYKMDPKIFFVELPGNYNPDGPYDRPYRHHREHNAAEAHYSNPEYRALISLRIGVEYEGARPEEVVRRVRESVATPHRAILHSKYAPGNGGRNYRGHEVKERAPRPWTMPEQDRRKVREERNQRSVQNENAFRGKHTQRVEETHKRDEKPQKERDRHEKDPKDPKKPR